MKKLWLGILISAALLMNIGSAAANSLTAFGNTASDPAYQAFNGDPYDIRPTFVSGVTDPNKGSVTFGATFWWEETATANSSTVTDSAINPLSPNYATTSSLLRKTYVEAWGGTDPEPIASTQVSVSTKDGPGQFAGSALATAFFVQEIGLNGIGNYLYSFLTSFTGTYDAKAPKVDLTGWSNATYYLGWWNPTTKDFEPGYYASQATSTVIGGKFSIDQSQYGDLTYVFDSLDAPTTGDVPAFGARSQSYVDPPAPLPSTLLLLGSGLLCLGRWGKKRIL